MLILKGVRLSIKKNIHKNTYLFRTNPKEKKGETSGSANAQTSSVSSTTPFTEILMKARKKRTAPQKNQNYSYVIRVRALPPMN